MGQPKLVCSALLLVADLYFPARVFGIMFAPFWLVSCSAFALLCGRLTVCLRFGYLSGLLGLFRSCALVLWCWCWADFECMWAAFGSIGIRWVFLVLNYARTGAFLLPCFRVWVPFLVPWGLWFFGYGTLCQDGNVQYFKKSTCFYSCVWLLGRQQIFGFVCMKIFRFCLGEPAGCKSGCRVGS